MKGSTKAKRMLKQLRELQFTVPEDLPFAARVTTGDLVRAVEALERVEQALERVELWEQLPTEWQERIRSMYPKDEMGYLTYPYWLNASELGKFLGVSPGTASQWMKNGSISSKTRTSGTKDRPFDKRLVNGFELMEWLIKNPTGKPPKK